jgi:hypothetical protein
MASLIATFSIANIRIAPPPPIGWPPEMSISISFQRYEGEAKLQ